MTAADDLAPVAPLMPRRTTRSTVLLCLITMVLGTGCGSTQVRVGFSGGRTADGMAYRFETFAATESSEVAVKTGQRLIVSYDAVVDKGVVTVHVLGPDGLVREAVLEESASGSLGLTADESGDYSITLRGEDAGGSIDIVGQVDEKAP